MPDLTVAQNIFIGREPRRAGLIRDDELVRRATALFERLGIPLDPRQPVSHLSVAGQQMVEIAKALSFDARVLIMDEPTAALTETEVATLFRIVRDFVSPRTGVIYVSHRMDEVKEISDRITVLRDGRYVDTLPTAGDRDPRGHRRDGGPAARDRRAARPRDGARSATGADEREVVLAVRGLSTRKLLKDVSFELHRGEILGFAGLMGAGRTEVARAIIGADTVDRRRRGQGQAGHGAQPRRRRPARHRLPLGGPQALRPAPGPGRGAQRHAVLAARHDPRGFRPGRRRAPGGDRDGGPALDPHTVGPPDGQEPLGRQPAEGGAGQVARAGLRRADRRRADARDRRRCKGRDLRPAHEPRRAGQVDHRRSRPSCPRCCGSPTG